MDVFPDFDGLAGIGDLKQVVGALFKIALWIAILAFAWWFFGPQLGLPFPF